MSARDLQGTRVLQQEGSRTRRMTLGKFLGEGGSGVVYELVEQPSLVAKIYIDAQKQPSTAVAAQHTPRIEAMMSRVPTIGQPIQGRGAVFPQLAWPVGLLATMQGAPLGFVMPNLPLSKSRDLEAVLTHESRVVDRIPDDYLLRLYIAKNLASALRELHREGHHVVDLKPQNIRAYTVQEALGTIAVIDADGFSVHGADGTRYPAQLASSEYMAPELFAPGGGPRSAGEMQDRWALAVIVFRLLNENVHPYQGRYTGPGENNIDEHVRNNRYAYGRSPRADLAPAMASIHEWFDDDTLNLFERAFGPNPRTRPEAREWRDHLERFTPDSGVVFRCRRNNDHWHFAKGCGLCAQDQARTRTQRPIQQPLPRGHTTVPPPPPPGPGAPRTAAGTARSPSPTASAGVARQARRFLEILLSPFVLAFRLIAGVFELIGYAIGLFFAAIALIFRLSIQVVKWSVIGALLVAGFKFVAPVAEQAWHALSAPKTAPNIAPTALPRRTTAGSAAPTQASMPDVYTVDADLTRALEPVFATARQDDSPAAVLARLDGTRRTFHDPAFDWRKFVRPQWKPFDDTATREASQRNWAAAASAERRALANNPGGLRLTSRLFTFLTAEPEPGAAAAGEAEATAKYAIFLQWKQNQRGRQDDWVNLAVAAALRGETDVTRGAFGVARALAANDDQRAQLCRTTVQHFERHPARLRSAAQELVDSLVAAPRSSVLRTCPLPAELRPRIQITTSAAPDDARPGVDASPTPSPVGTIAPTLPPMPRADPASTDSSAPASLPEATPSSAGVGAESPQRDADTSGQAR